MMAGPLCLLLGAGFLADRVYAVNPDAVAVAGAALAVRAEAGPDRLALAVEGPAGPRLRAIAADAGGPAAAKAWRPTECPPDSARVMVVDHPGRAVGPAQMLWPPDTVDSGAGPAPEIARALREFAGLAVPRPLPPAEHPVTVLRLPGSTPDARLLGAAFASPWTSWLRAGDAVYLAQDAAPDPMPPGARHLADGAPLGRLWIVGAEPPPEGATVLDRFPGGALLLCPPGCEAGEPWLAHRFGQIGG